MPKRTYGSTDEQGRIRIFEDSPTEEEIMRPKRYDDGGTIMPAVQKRIRDEVAGMTNEERLQELERIRQRAGTSSVAVPGPVKNPTRSARFAQGGKVKPGTNYRKWMH